MREIYLKLGKGKMKKSRNGFRESRRWDRSFASLPYSIAVMGREKVY